MNRPFLLFSGAHYYPSQAWRDFRGAFATLSEALEATANEPGDWWQVVNLDTLQVEKEGERS